MTEKEIQEKIKKYKINKETLDSEYFYDSRTVKDIIYFLETKKVDPLKYNQVSISGSDCGFDLYYTREKTKEEILREIEINDKKYEQEKTQKENNQKRNEILKKLTPEERKFLGFKQ